MGKLDGFFAPSFPLTLPTEQMMKRYRKTAEILARPYILGEDLRGVSVSPNDDPSKGGYIAQQPDDPNDRWFIALDVFHKTYVEANT